MTIFDLLFIVGGLGSFIALLRAGYLALRRRNEAAQRVVRRWIVFAASYIAIVVVVSLIQPRRVVPIGQEQCFDDWCIAVDSVTHPDAIGAERAQGKWVVVTTHVSSHMRGRRQSEPDAYGYLLDGSGRRFDESERGQAALGHAGIAGSPLGAVIEPNGSIMSRLAFDIPAGAQGLGFVKERRSRFPAIIIIGDPVSLFHRRTVVLF